MGWHRTKKHLHSEGNYQQNERQATEWEKTFANDMFDNGPKYTKSSYIST